MEETVGLKKPLEPRMPESYHYHLPSRYKESRGHHHPLQSSQYPKSSMQALVEHLRSKSPRPKSPQLMAEEPINLAAYPDARKPQPTEVPRIERDDFPGPPYYCFAKKSWSTEELETPNGDYHHLLDYDDVKLKREEQELSKITTGIGRVFLESVKQREKQKKLAHMDPRRASRSSSAKKDVHQRLRYDNPVSASPSRDMDRPKPWEDEVHSCSVFIGSNGQRVHVPPPSNSDVVHYINVPRPGYRLRSATPNGGYTDSRCYGRSPSPFSKSSKTHSELGFSSGKSDISTHDSDDQQQLDQSDSRYQLSYSVNHNYRPSPFSEVGFSGYKSAHYSAHLRKSMPNVSQLHTNGPVTIYPYHLLVTTNYHMPRDIDRCHLERHLSKEEFTAIFNMSRVDFYRMPEWKRNQLKKRFRLF